MALRTIITEEDERLRKKSRPVTDFGARTQEQIDDLIDTLANTGNGIGLAAVQIGLLKRMFIVNIEDEGGLRVYVNPEIIETRGEQINTEGCLSIPNYWGEVKRPEWIKVRAQDRHGETFELEAEGLLAICICHENDHLDGVLFTDKLEGELTYVE